MGPLGTDDVMRSYTAKQDAQLVFSTILLGDESFLFPSLAMSLSCLGHAQQLA